MYQLHCQVILCPTIEPKSRLMFSGNITLRPSSLTVACLTTKDCWVFAPYSIEERGEQDVPLIYLKEARWRTIRGSTGYFVNIPTRPSQYYPIEFNHNFVCWTEITWNAPNNRWNIERPTGPDYRCDIFEDEVQTMGQVCYVTVGTSARLEQNCH